MIPYSKLSLHNLKKIIKHFCCDITATKTGELLGYNRKTINHYYELFRQLIYLSRLEAFREKIDGEIEVDESYF
jgi:predicted metallopeptidase